MQTIKILLGRQKKISLNL